jgi:hypothetical protein
MKYIALVAMLLTGIFIGSLIRPFHETMAQEPSSSSQIIETGQIASEHDLELLRQDLRAK